MDESEVIISSTEIIKDRLYFATLKTGYKPKATRNSKYFHIEDDIVYENFYFDFGPYHLCHLYQFCNKLNAELEKNPKKKIVFYTSSNETLRLNAAYLIGSYQIIYLAASPTEVFQRLTAGEWSLLTFRDASGGPPLFDISLADVFQGVKVAHDARFIDFNHFDEHEYLFYEKVENGDLNWIIPEKMLAFSGPHHRARLDRGYPLHSPEHYHHYFRTHNVTTIVRLNKKSYDARQFTAHGFEHRELFFVDGSVPSDVIVNRFLRVAEAARGAVAVHCKAGLGRTGTLIACYLMKHHAFCARGAVAWLRVCRPGSVIGHQQWFLENVQTRMHAEGEAYRRRHSMAAPPGVARGLYSALPLEPLPRAAPPAAPDKTGPVTLATILNNRNAKLDNANVLNANETDAENNVTAVIGKYRSAAAAPAKPAPRLLNAALKSHYAAKTATFPPARAASAGKMAAAKMAAGKSFHGQRANLARPAPAAVSSTLSALTANCHLNGRARAPAEPGAKKKILARSSSVTRRRPPRAGAEPMDCPAADAAPDDYEETTNSQGNKLYKIKALRKKCPAFGASLLKKDGVQTRSGGAGAAAVKKK